MGLPEKWEYLTSKTEVNMHCILDLCFLVFVYCLEVTGFRRSFFFFLSFELYSEDGYSKFR